jgi:DNA adenine methylase
VKPTRPILRYHGGKWRLAPWIVGFFGEHSAYVEPFGGAASVLVQKPRAYAEIYNDLDGEIVNLFRMLRDHGAELMRLVELTLFSRVEFDESFLPALDPIEQARRTILRSFAGYGGNLTRPNRDGSTQKTGFRTYSKKNRRSIPAGDWRNYPEAMVMLIERLRGVIVEQKPALEVIAKHDAEDTLFYVDPPYVHVTRSWDAGGTHRAYRHEMDDDAHRVLGGALRATKGMVVLSGYPCELYDRELFPDWKRVERAHLADGARPRTEVLWLNSAAQNALEHRNLARAA